jgi:hypothetical protein
VRIAFAGQSRSGKDEAISYLTKGFNSSWIKLHIADEIYSIARRIKGDDIQSTKPEDRRLLQDIGMAGRRFNKEIWIDRLCETIDEFDYYKTEGIFVTGIRFENEVIRLREAGFTVILLKRDKELREELGAPKDPHETEIPLEEGLFKAEDIIHNNSTLELFHKSLYDRFLKK